jgi:hypothetical protein
MGKTGNVRSGSRARRSRRELHERYVTVYRNFSRRTSSEAYKCTESRTKCRPDHQEELSPGIPDSLIRDPDPEHGCGILDSEHELELSHVVHNWSTDCLYVSRKQRKMSS